jgi:predicted alpha-1,6-mannanase (GH76 family)
MAPKMTCQLEEQMLKSSPQRLVSRPFVFLVLAVVWVGSPRPASAFTAADATALMNSFNNAFYTVSGGLGYYKKFKSGSVNGFWQEAEIIEAVEDTFDRTGSTIYRNMISELLDGFTARHGTSWSANSFNDDIMWACIAYLRGYERTGDTTFRTIARANFDMAFARGWDTSVGGFWWTTAKTSKTSAVMGPASIAAHLLHVTSGDDEYRMKAITINDWQRANCFNEDNGQVYDSPSNHTPTTYNQGTFINASYNRGSTGAATKAADYLQTMGGTIVDGHHIMPQYATGGDGSGFNGIAIRWVSKFMKDMGLQSRYLGWLQTNAQQAWNVRRLSDGLSWCKWGSPLQNGVQVGSWDTVNSVVALQVVPPN